MLSKFNKIENKSNSNAPDSDINHSGGASMPALTVKDAFSNANSPVFPEVTSMKVEAAVTVDDAVEQILTSVKKTIKSMLDTAKLLLKYSDHADWKEIKRRIVSEKIMSDTYVSYWLKIGRAKYLHNPKIYPSLPPKLRTLYELVGLGKVEILKRLDNEEINPETTIKDVLQWQDEIKRGTDLNKLGPKSILTFGDDGQDAYSNTYKSTIKNKKSTESPPDQNGTKRKSRGTLALSIFVESDDLGCDVFNLLSEHFGDDSRVVIDSDKLDRRIRKANEKTMREGSRTVIKAAIQVIRAHNKIARSKCLNFKGVLNKVKYRATYPELAEFFEGGTKQYEDLLVSTDPDDPINVVLESIGDYETTQEFALIKGLL